MGKIKRMLRILVGCSLVLELRGLLMQEHPPVRNMLNKKVSELEAADVQRLGNSLTVPSLGLGTISWVTPEKKLFVPGDSFSASRNSAVQEQKDTAQKALEMGLNFFDSAERYSVGAGESLLADAVGTDMNSVLATKFTPLPWRRDPESVVEACRASAQRLGLDTIDLYQIHMPDVVQPGRILGYVENKDKVYWQGLVKCVELGLVKEIGVSNYGPTKLNEAYNFFQSHGIQLASNQIHLSLLARNQGNLNALERAKELGITTLAYYPLSRGLLTSSARKYLDKRSPLRHYVQGGTGYVGFSEKNRVHVPPGGVLPLVDALELVAAKIGKTASQVALNWIITKGAIPIVGVTNQKYLLDAVGALGWRLSDDDLAFLEDTSDALGFEFRGTFFKRTDSKFVGYGVESWALD